MDNKITINLDTFKFILNQESKKLIGTSMKRFEISDNKEDIKRAIKELQYEWCRNLYDIFADGKILLQTRIDNKE